MTTTNDDRAKPSILVVTQLYPNVVTSFLGTFVARQLQHLKDRYEIVVLTAHYIPLTKRRVLRQPRYEFRDGVHVYSLPSAAYWLFGFGIVDQRLLDLVLIDKLLMSRKIARFARNLHRKHHFSLVHGHETYIGDEAATIGRMLGIPSVFTLDGIYWYHVKTFGNASVNKAVANINACDRLTATSRISAESYRSHGVRRVFDIIPNGVDTQRPGSQYPKVPDDIAAFTRDRLVLLTVGFFVAEKRIEQSIRTLARLHQDGIRNAVLIVIGKGPLQARYRSMIDHEGLGHAVRIVGEVPPQGMSGYYSVADVLVHPSVVESFSMVCLEAMSQGKPIVCTSNIGLVEHLHPGRDAVVIPPDHPEALYQAVLGLIQDPLRRRAIGEEARNAASRLSLSNQVQKIERIYQQVLSESLP
jgi:glycosyltransferase involved in cell wall biosynthesis